MFHDSLGRAALGLAALLTATTTARAAAEVPDSAGPLGAQALVSGISAQRTAQAEAKLRKPAAESSPSPVLKVAVPKLASRLELTAGSDHLVGSSGLVKQSSVFAGARYRLNEWLQFGASAAVRIQGDGNGTVDMAAQLLFGPTFNIGTGSGIENAFFITPKIGPTLARTVIDGGDASYRSTLAFEVTAGKRFTIGKNIALAPAIGEVWQRGYQACIVVQPIAFSIFF